MRTPGYIEEIEERRLYLEGVLGAAPDAIVTLDAHHRIVEWNAGAERLFWYSRQEAIGRNIDRLVTNPDVFDEAIGFTQEIMSGKDLHPIESIRYRKDGSPVDVIVAGSSILVGNKLIGAVTIYTDITDRKRAEDEVRQRAEELATLYATSLDITARLELSDLLWSIVRRAAELLGASGGSLYLYRPEQDELELVVSHNLVADYTGTRLKVGEGLSGRVMATGQPLIVSDYRTWEGQVSTYDEAPFTAVIGVPLRWQDRILGVINVTDLGERQPFDENDLHLLEAFAQQVAVALENARLHEGVRQRLEQLDVLYQVAEAGSRTLELQPLLQGLLDRILAITGMQIGAFYQLDQTAQQLHLLVHRGLSAEFAARMQTYEPGQGITGRAMASGQTVVLEDALDVPELRETSRRGGFRSQISLPLRVAGKIIGVLNLNSKGPRPWPLDEMRWLEAVAVQVAI